MKTILMSVVTAIAMMTFAAGAATEPFAYIDMQKAIQATNAGKKAKTSLETEFNKKKKELEKRESDLKKMTEDLSKKAGVMSDEARAKRQQEVQEEMLKYRELVGKSQLDIQKRERDLTLPIVQKIRTIVDAMAKKEGFAMVFEKSEQSVLWAKPELDLTDKVIKEFNK